MVNILADVFDIFNDVFNGMQTTKQEKKELDPEESLSEITKLNGIDMKDVSKKDFDDIMNYLDKIKDNDAVTWLLGDEFISKFQAELQAKWDMAHDEPEEETTTTDETTLNPSSVDAQIEKYVDEYMESIGVDTERLKKNYLIQTARQSYINFAKFIYNHD